MLAFALTFAVIGGILGLIVVGLDGIIRGAILGVIALFLLVALSYAGAVILFVLNEAACLLLSFGDYLSSLWHMLFSWIPPWISGLLAIFILVVVIVSIIIISSIGKGGGGSSGISFTGNRFSGGR